MGEDLRAVGSPSEIAEAWSCWMRLQAHRCSPASARTRDIRLNRMAMSLTDAGEPGRVRCG